MGTDALALVDPQLRVHGISGLRVVDASIMPTPIGSNTNAPPSCSPSAPPTLSALKRWFRAPHLSA
jgi:hypothetical protein